jgi:hypothetical protein
MNIIQSHFSSLSAYGLNRSGRLHKPGFLPWRVQHRVGRILVRFPLLVAAALLHVCLPHAIMAGLPKVILVENHGDVLIHWVKTGVKGAVVVNVDAHDDCAPIPANFTARLRHFFTDGNTAAIERANSAADSGLYGIRDFISAACAIGVAREVVWVAPPLTAQSLVWTHLTFRTCPPESLPELKGPVFLTVDADFIPTYAATRCINEVEAVRRIGETLRAVPWNVVHASVCFSVDGGYLPVTLRWVGNALQEALEGKNLSRPGAPWQQLGTVENWRRGELPHEVVRLVSPLVLKHPGDPWLHVYLADALFRADDISGALAEGRKAAQLDSGCCRILPEMGRQLADAGRLDEAEKFLAAAPAVVNFTAEIALARALDRAGHTARAIPHLLRLRGQLANYSVDLLLGYGYERLGDSTRARQHYLGAVALLAAPVSEMSAFPDLAPAVASAERFLRTTGHKRQAKAFRRDPRIVTFFDKHAEQ